MSKRLSARHVPLAVSMALVLLAGVLPGSPGAAYAAKPKTASDPPRPMVSTSSATALAVSAALWSTCAIRADGTLGCWGSYEDTPAPPPEGSFTAVSAGYKISDDWEEAWATNCAVAAGGGLVCWGDNPDGVATPPNGVYTAVRVGGNFACALDAAGLATCWGNNDYRQLQAPSVPLKAIDAGASHACAIRASDDMVVCWGANGLDQAEPPPGTYLAVDAGDANTCAIETDGDLVCWGFNGNNRSLPPVGKYTSLSVGYAHACAVKDDGSVACWGDDEGGQATPPPGATFKAVDAGFLHTCGIRLDDTLTCWGDDSDGQVIPRPIAQVDHLVPWATTSGIDVHWGARAALADVVSYDVRYERAPWNGDLGSAVTWQSLTPNTSATLAASAGSTYCFIVRAYDADENVSDWAWGGCTVVPLDDRALARGGAWTVGTDAGAFAGTYVRSSTAGATLTRTGVVAAEVALLATTCENCGSVGVYFGTSTKPVRVVSLYSPTPVASKLIPLFVVDEDEDPYSLGTLTLKVASSGKPVTIDGLLTTRIPIAPAWADANDPPLPGIATATEPVEAVSAGYNHSCAIRLDGTVGCWGDNAYGKATPPVGAFKKVSAGYDLTCAIRDSDGTLMCWGDGSAGVSVPPEGAFTDLALGKWDACAIEANGALACWGEEYGDDGWYDPPSGSYTAITYVASSSGWGDTFCAIREGGKLACWGDAYDDESDGAITPSGTFTAIAGSCGIRTDHSVTCWGSDELGQSSPPDGDFKAIASGLLHTCAIKSDDTITCWGDDAYLETAAPAGAFGAIDAGEHHTCAITTGGTLACWGQDRVGQVTPRPQATMKTLPSWPTTRSIALAWSGTSLPAITTYDIRYRRAAWNGSFGAVAPLLTGVATTSATPVGAAGSTYCYSARAYDAAGAVSAWSGETCTAIPLDDRSLTRSGSWTAGTGSAYYNATYLRTTSSGAALTRTRVVATRLALVATTCPTCGSVKVYWNGTLLKTISLASATTVNKKVIAIKTWTSGHAGTLKLKVSTSGKKVLIDGVVIRRN